MGCLGWCGTMLRCLVYVAVPLAAVLVYFHLECVRWNVTQVHNDLFKCLISTGRRMRPWGPSSMKSITLTPLTVRLNCPLPLGTVLPTSLVRYQPFQYCLISLTLMILPGPEFMLMQWIPCSLSKLITFISLAIGRLLRSIFKVFELFVYFRNHYKVGRCKKGKPNG